MQAYVAQTVTRKKSLVLKVYINFKKYREYMSGFAFVGLAGFLLLYQVLIPFAPDYYIYESFFSP